MTAHITRNALRENARLYYLSFVSLIGGYVPNLNGQY